MGLYNFDLFADVSDEFKAKLNALSIKFHHQTLTSMIRENLYIYIDNQKIYEIDESIFSEIIKEDEKKGKKKGNIVIRVSDYMNNSIKGLTNPVSSKNTEFKYFVYLMYYALKSSNRHPNHQIVKREFYLNQISNQGLDNLRSQSMIIPYYNLIKLKRGKRKIFNKEEIMNALELSILGEDYDYKRNIRLKFNKIKTLAGFTYNYSVERGKNSRIKFPY